MPGLHKAPNKCLMDESALTQYLKTYVVLNICGLNSEFDEDTKNKKITVWIIIKYVFLRVKYL